MEHKNELAKAYHERIIERNEQAEAWGLDAAFIAGYDAAMSECIDYMSKALGKIDEKI